MRNTAFAAAAILITSLACSGAADTTTPIEVVEAPEPDRGPSAWDGKEPFFCDGDQNLKIHNVTAKIGKGKTAVTATGKCKLDLLDVNVSADIGFDVTEGAVIKMKRVTVKGKNAAIQASGRAKVTGSGKIKGEVKAVEKAKIDVAKGKGAGEGGSASTEPSPTTPASAPSPAPASAPKAAPKKDCSGIKMKCWEDANWAQHLCRSDCPTSGNVCNDAACKACQEGCDSTKDATDDRCEDAYRACE
jgi:hypothetical protein